MQPGAPGEATRVITATQAVDVVRIRPTATDAVHAGHDRPPGPGAGDDGAAAVANDTRGHAPAPSADTNSLGPT